MSLSLSLVCRTSIGKVGVGWVCTTSADRQQTYSIVRLSKRADTSHLGCLGWCWTLHVSSSAPSVLGSLAQIRVCESGGICSHSYSYLHGVHMSCHVVHSDSIRSRTQGGIFTTPGDAYTTPVDMWVKALGELFFFLRGTQTRLNFFADKKSNLSSQRSGSSVSFRCWVASGDLCLYSFSPPKIFFWRKLAEIMRSQGSNQLAALHR